MAYSISNSIINTNSEKLRYTYLINDCCYCLNWCVRACADAVAVATSTAVKLNYYGRVKSNKAKKTTTHRRRRNIRK